MLRILIVSLLLVFSCQLAHAAVCTATVASLDFGPVDTIGNATADATADVVIACDAVTAGTGSISVCANLGAGSGGLVNGTRQVTAGAGTLGFALYTDSGHTEVWGTAADAGLGASHPIAVPVSGTTAGITVRLYGLIPGNQAAAPVGNYRSDLSATDSVFIYSEGALDCVTPVGGTDTAAPFAVTAEVAADCLIVASNLDFGTAGVIGANIDAATNMRVTCTPGAHYAISLDGGRSGATDPEARLMTSGSMTVVYGLYSDATRASPWGVATPVEGDGDGTRQSLQVYGRIPPQAAEPGAYSDTVVVTITY